MPQKPLATRHSKTERDARRRKVEQVKNAIDAIGSALMETGVSNDVAVTAQVAVLSMTMKTVIAQTRQPVARKRTRLAFTTAVQHLLMGLAAPMRN